MLHGKRCNYLTIIAELRRRPNLELSLNFAFGKRGSMDCIEETRFEGSNVAFMVLSINYCGCSLFWNLSIRSLFMVVEFEPSVVSDPSFLKQ